MKFRFIFGVGFLFCVCLVTSSITYAYQEAKLWSVWEAHDDANEQAVIDHSVFDDFLKKYVALGYVNKLRYKEVTQEDEELLEAYLNTLEALPISIYPREQQLFYWINLYNAYVIKSVLNHYPVASVEDIDLSPELFREGPWQQKVLTIEGYQVSLSDIKNLILRPIWRDPRILYTLHSAHIGSPYIQPYAWTPERFDTHIDTIIRDYINHPYTVSVSSEGILTISSFYDWYSGDFGEENTSLIDHLTQYADLPLQEKLKSVDSDFVYDYDFSLNEELTEKPQPTEDEPTQ